MDLTWYLRRLRAMTPAEVVERASVAGRRLRWRVGGPGHAGAEGAASALPDRSLASRRLSTGVLPPPPLALGDGDASTQLRAAADGVLAGRWPVLGALRTDLDAPDWWADGLGGPSAPAGHAFSVPYRDRHRVGSVKHTWELSRQQHVTVLGAAYRVTG